MEREREKKAIHWMRRAGTHAPIDPSLFPPSHGQMFIHQSYSMPLYSQVLSPQYIYGKVFAQLPMVTSPSLVQGTIDRSAKIHPSHDAVVLTLQIEYSNDVVLFLTCVWLPAQEFFSAMWPWIKSVPPVRRGCWTWASSGGNATLALRRRVSYF